jgi:hypothetical protein
VHSFTQWQMDHYLMCPMQLRLHDIAFNERPKLLTTLPSDNDHAIQAEDLLIRLGIYGMSYFPGRNPTPKEYNTCARIWTHLSRIGMDAVWCSIIRRRRSGFPFWRLCSPRIPRTICHDVSTGREIHSNSPELHYSWWPGNYRRRSIVSRHVIRWKIEPHLGYRLICSLAHHWSHHTESCEYRCFYECWITLAYRWSCSVPPPHQSCCVSWYARGKCRVPA